LNTHFRKPRLSAQATWALGLLVAAAGLAQAGTAGDRAAPQAVQAARVAQSARTAPAAQADRWRDSDNARWRGENLADLAARWTRWLTSMPAGVHPFGGDESGANCGINQEGPVWFLAAPLVAAYTGHCIVPAGKAIAMPVFSYLNDYPCPDASFQPPPGQSLETFLGEFAAMLSDATSLKAASLNGRSLPVRRVASRLFGFTGAASLQTFDACITGSPQLGLIDGWWVLIDPLPPGRHVLTVQVNNPFTGATQGSFTLNVR
jgi:hypothetical protein